MEENKEVAKEIETETPKNKRRDIIQICFLIILLLAVGAMVSAVVTVHKYSDMLSNPLGYNMDRFNIQLCNCYDKDFKVITIKSINYNSSFDYLQARPIDSFNQLNISIKR